MLLNWNETTMPLPLLMLLSPGRRESQHCTKPPTAKKKACVCDVARQKERRKGNLDTNPILQLNNNGMCSTLLLPLARIVRSEREF
jgi:hypothetical protein